MNVNDCVSVGHIIEMLVDAEEIFPSGLSNPDYYTQVKNDFRIGNKFIVEKTYQSGLTRLRNLESGNIYDANEGVFDRDGYWCILLTGDVNINFQISGFDDGNYKSSLFSKFAAAHSKTEMLRDDCYMLNRKIENDVPFDNQLSHSVCKSTAKEMVKLWSSILDDLEKYENGN